MTCVSSRLPARHCLRLAINKTDAFREVDIGGMLTVKSSLGLFRLTSIPDSFMELAKSVSAIVLDGLRPAMSGLTETSNCTASAVAFAMHLTEWLCAL